MGLVSQLRTRKPLERKSNIKKTMVVTRWWSHVYHPPFWDKPNLYPMIIPWSISVRSVVSSHQQAINQASKLSDVRPNSAAERSKRKSGRQQLVASYFCTASGGVHLWLSLCLHNGSFWVYPDMLFHVLVCRHSSHRWTAKHSLVLDWVGSSSLETELFCQERGGGKKESTTASTIAGQRRGKNFSE